MNCNQACKFAPACGMPSQLLRDPHACLCAHVPTTSQLPNALVFPSQVDPLPDGIPALEQPAALVQAAQQDITAAEQLAQAKSGLEVGRGAVCQWSPLRPIYSKCPCMAICLCLARASAAASHPRLPLTLAASPQFAERAPSMAPGLRRRSLAALRRVLTAQQAALFSPASDSNDGGKGADGSKGMAGACLPEVASSAWRLAVLSSELCDAELAVGG